MTQLTTPERKFWCAVIAVQVWDARNGNATAQRWFYSHMWETVSTTLLTPTIIHAIEDKVFSSQVKEREYTEEQLKARRESHRQRYSRIKAAREKV